jgi:hypothetical protein
LVQRDPAWLYSCVAAGLAAPTVQPTEHCRGMAGFLVTPHIMNGQRMVAMVYRMTGQPQPSGGRSARRPKPTNGGGHRFRHAACPQLSSEEERRPRKGEDSGSVYCYEGEWSSSYLRRQDTGGRKDLIRQVCDGNKSTRDHEFATAEFHVSCLSLTSLG